MVHERFEYEMLAPAAVVFDAFHFHTWRMRWDSLVRATQVEGGGECPHVGAVTSNAGGGAMRLLSMRTRFVSFDRPRGAAAVMIGRSFPFRRWAASMRHREIDAQRSVMIYTYTIDAGPLWLAWLLEPVVKRVFDRQTHRRFERLQRFVEQHRTEIERWQSERQSGADATSSP